jgi:hypothetical protein
MDKSWILIDEATGLHHSWYFWLRVLDEVNRSARYGAPFGLLLLETELDAGTAPRHADEAAAAVPAAIRSTDLGGLIGRGRVGVMLTHQDADSAQAAMQRVVERLKGHEPPGVRWRSRLLTYPEDGGEISSLLTTGWAAHPAETGVRRPA